MTKTKLTRLLLLLPIAFRKLLFYVGVFCSNNKNITNVFDLKDNNNRKSLFFEENIIYLWDTLIFDIQVKNLKGNWNKNTE